MTSSSPESPRQLYNSRIIDTYIKLIKSRYSYVNIGELLSKSGMKPYEVADQGHWFTQDQVNRFYEALVDITKNENIAREAGRYSASPDAIGVMRQYILGMVSPATVYELIGKATANFTRSSRYESRRISPTKIEITVTPHPGVTERLFQCENRLGFFDAIVNIYQNKYPVIEHPECLFEGGSVCRYLISWENSPSAKWAVLRNYSAPVFITINILLAILGRWHLLEHVAATSLIAFLFLALITRNRETQEIKASLDHTRESIDTLLDQINRNYNNALMTNEIGQAISTHTTVADILASVSQIMEKRLDFDRGLILLANKEQSLLELCTGYGYTEEQIRLYEKVAFHLDKPDAKGIFVVSFREQRPFLINDINEIEETLSPRSLEMARQMGTLSFICCPITCSDKTLGVLAVDNVNSKRPLIESDMSLLMGIASALGISLRNAEHIEASVRQFNSILQVLAASIDARDSLTAGHSEKVTEYSLGICDELELSGDYREMIRVAALLHDYGKLAVPDAILKKKGSLTEQEYEIVKNHADKSREILSQINFEGIFRKIPEIAGAHHEKVNGTGYPKGLSGKEIPVGAQIISVADYFEAITAKRHYRDPMPVDEAFGVLRGQIGEHFEREYVEALINYYTRTYLSDTASFPYPARRRENRVQFRTEVHFRLYDRFIPGETKDISANGVFIITPEHAEVNQIIEVILVLPQCPSGIVRVLGRIAWINSASVPLKTSYPNGFGVEIEQFDSGGEALIRSVTRRVISATRNYNS